MSDPQADWRARFLQLFLADNRADNEAAFDLKAHHTPPALFRFRNANDRALEHLDAGTISLSAPSTFNDPFDSRVQFDAKAVSRVASRWNDPEGRALLDEGCSEMGVSPEEMLLLLEGNAPQEVIERVTEKYAPSDRDALTDFMRNKLPALAAKHLADGPEMQQLETALRDGYRVACFTEQATSKLFWGHYADSHRGFCIEYAPQDLDEAPRRLLLPAIYGAKRYDFTQVMVQAGSGDAPIPNHAIAATLHKSVEWAYEREWRLILPLGGQTQWTQIPWRASAVIGGVSMKQDDRSRLNEICKRRRIPLRSASLSRDTYDVIIEQ